MILTELWKIFPEFKVTKYGKVSEDTIWIEKKGTYGRLTFTYKSQNNYILKKES